FFSVFYVADLQFPRTTTFDQLGKERAANRESQLKEVNEALVNLFANLKANRQWDNTYVMVVGLNGTTRLHAEDELGATNLYSENTQVLMMIKPAHRARDQGQA